MINISIDFSPVADIKPGEIPDSLRVKYGPHICCSMKDVTKEEVEALVNFQRSLETNPEKLLNWVSITLREVRKKFPDLS